MTSRQKRLARRARRKLGIKLTFKKKTVQPITKKQRKASRFHNKRNIFVPKYVGTGLGRVR